MEWIERVPVQTDVWLNGKCILVIIFCVVNFNISFSIHVFICKDNDISNNKMQNCAHRRLSVARVNQAMTMYKSNRNVTNAHILNINT